MGRMPCGIGAPLLRHGRSLSGCAQLGARRGRWMWQGFRRPRAEASAASGGDDFGSHSTASALAPLPWDLCGGLQRADMESDGSVVGLAHWMGSGSSLLVRGCAFSRIEADASPSWVIPRNSLRGTTSLRGRLEQRPFRQVLSSRPRARIFSSTLRGETLRDVGSGDAQVPFCLPTAPSLHACLWPRSSKPRVS